ncbi:MAG: hypothetical protein GF353_01340 [Candidatus Lokiarchaeota archaeon]|nr:hypothetical protein [Candidatus Lokiarchaeota archaeon]
MIGRQVTAMDNLRDYLKWVQDLEDNIDINSEESLPEKKQEPAALNDRNGYSSTDDPFLDKNNDLIIPMYTNSKYRWWQGGQDILVTLLELGADATILDRYVSDWRAMLVRWEEGN